MLFALLSLTATAVSRINDDFAQIAEVCDNVAISMVCMLQQTWQLLTPFLPQTWQQQQQQGCLVCAG
jgi:hypothetical protein